MMRNVCVSALAVALVCASAWATEVDQYNFTGNTNDSVGTNNATLENGATISGNALQLNGSSQYAELPSGLLNNFTSLTIEVWFTWATDTDQTWARLFDFGSGTNSYLYLTPDVGSGWTFPGQSGFALQAPGPSGPGERDLQGPAITPGVETFMAITIEPAGAGNSTVTMYMNGFAVASTVIANVLSDLNATTNNWLGQSEFSGNPYFDGSIDQLSIYNDAESSDAVLAAYNEGPEDPIPEPGTALLLLASLCLIAVPRAIRHRASR
jgi:hypothetical protein